MIVVQEMHKVFVSDSEQSRVYSFYEPSLTNLQFLELGGDEDPATLSYDPVHRRLFVAAPGAEYHATVDVPGQLPIQKDNIDPATESLPSLYSRTPKRLAAHHVLWRPQ